MGRGVRDGTAGPPDFAVTRTQACPAPDHLAVAVGRRLLLVAFGLGQMVMAWLAFTWAPGALT